MVQDFLAGRVRRKIQPRLLHRSRDIQIHHARLHHRPLIFQIDFQNAVHAREYDHYAAASRQCASRQTGSRASTDDGQLVLGGEFHDARNFFACVRKHHYIRTAFFYRAVVLIQH